MSDDYSDDRAGSTPSEGAVPIAAPASPYAAAYTRAAHATGTTVPWLNLPHELRKRGQWLVSVGKVPHTHSEGNKLVPASVTDPAHWLTFNDAMTIAGWRGDRGIGYVLSADDPFTCIDLDVKDHTTPEQMELFRRMLYGFDTYAERSLSGRGLHLWCRGKVGKGVRRDGVEVYSQERFIVCTGDTVLDTRIRERQQFLDNMVSQMRALGTAPAPLVELPPLESDYDQYARKVRASNGAHFSALWNGWWQGNYPSQSEAHMALVRMLCFNNPSNEQVRRMFRLSALGQRKKSARVDYVDGMIAAARAADAERARVHAQVTAAMAPGIDAELAAWQARVRGNLG